MGNGSNCRDVQLNLISRFSTNSIHAHFVYQGAPFHPQIVQLLTHLNSSQNARLSIRRLLTPTIIHQRLKERKKKSDGTLDFPPPALTWHNWIDSHHVQSTKCRQLLRFLGGASTDFLLPTRKLGATRR